MATQLKFSMIILRVSLVCKALTSRYLSKSSQQDSRYRSCPASRTLVFSSGKPRTTTSMMFIGMVPSSHFVFFQRCVSETIRDIRFFKIYRRSTGILMKIWPFRDLSEAQSPWTKMQEDFNAAAAKLAGLFKVGGDFPKMEVWCRCLSVWKVGESLRWKVGYVHFGGV